MKQKVQRRSALVAIGMVTVLAGCSAQPQDDAASAPEFVPPAWMATQVQFNDELLAHQASCLTESGFAYELLEQGGFSFPEETREEARAALSDCTREYVGEDYRKPPTEDELRKLYRAVLDTRDCLINEGFTIPEPVSEEKYVDSGGEYSPYLSVNGLNDSEWVQLQRKCPEPGSAAL